MNQFPDVTDEFFEYLKEHSNTIGFMWQRIPLPRCVFKRPPSLEYAFPNSPSIGFIAKTKKFKSKYTKPSHQGFAELIQELWIDSKSNVLKPRSYEERHWRDTAYVIQSVKYPAPILEEEQESNQTNCFWYQFFVSYTRIPTDVLLYNNSLPLRNYYMFHYNAVFEEPKGAE